MVRAFVGMDAQFHEIVSKFIGSNRPKRDILRYAFKETPKGKRSF
jgi:hypothetical protein